MKSLTELSSWQALENYLNSPYSLNHSKDTELAQKIKTSNITLDFSKQNLNSTTMKLLEQLALESNLPQKILALTSGEKINKSENCPALHTALRSLDNKPLYIEGKDIKKDILDTLNKMQQFAEQIREGKWLGFSGKPITNIVNIGIGGSDFGPRFCLDALNAWVAKNLNFYFVSDADPTSFDNVVCGLDPAETLFIIASKSFKTIETIYNAKKAFQWMDGHLANHFIAVTANQTKANEFGITNFLPIWNFIGGRFSLCSAVNFITCIAIGPKEFMAILSGAYSMDLHFLNTKPECNMPIILALIGLLNINFRNIPTQLFLVYAKQLEQFVNYVQQLDMESNGKSIDIHGKAINYATGPIVWGGSGNQAQHSYFQLLNQGTHRVAIDILTIGDNENDLINSLCRNNISLLSSTKVKNNLNYSSPINHIKIHSWSPYSLGTLIALYEHKIFCQGAIWNLNSFDQPAVEHTKLQNYANEFADPTP